MIEAFLSVLIGTLFLMLMVYGPALVIGFVAVQIRNRYQQYKLDQRRTKDREHQDQVEGRR